MEYVFKNGCPEFPPEAPNKRFKMQNQENSPPRPPSPSQSGSLSSFLKGKSKLEPEKEPSVCGICLSEADEDGNNACRGYIDCCDHYFCFVCIMEWAKIENKCPLCKRRFCTIRRPSKPPFFPTGRIVRVSVRDQADASTSPLDSNARCTVCHSSAYEGFLLLCDLCDSASHTYCVGLGATVPEGDWFCRDCTLLMAESTELSNSGNLHGSLNDRTEFDIVRDPEAPIGRVERSPEHTESELDIGSSELSNSRNPNGNPNYSPKNMTLFDDERGPESPISRVKRSSEHTESESSELSNSGDPNSSPKNVTVFDIVRDLGSPIRRVTWFSTGTILDDRTGIDKRGQGSNVQDSSRLSARTLQQRRNVLEHIQALRDNWNGFRSGYLNFSSTSSSSSNQTCETASNSAQLHSASSLLERLNSENGPLVPTKNRSVHEIDKAWKMMHMAKSLEQKHGSKGIRDQASKSAFSPKHLSTDDKLLGSANLVRIRQEKQPLHHSLVNNSNKHRTQILEKRSLPVQGFQNCSTGFSISSSPVYSKVTSPQNTSSPHQYDLCSGNGRNLPKETEAIRMASATSNHCSKSVSLRSSAGSTRVASNSYHARLELPASSSCKIEPPKHKDKSVKEKNPVDLKKQGNNDAKSEIQSLVKLNLKLLTKDKHLGVNAFKEVARSATHSILATCGLERPKPGIRLFPSSACHHAIEGLDIRRSTLMPNSCRECFYVFVKDIVSTIMLEKVEGADVS